MGYFNRKHYEINEELELKRNGEGYPDPTAYEAVKRAEPDDYDRKRFLRVVGCVLRILELSGFHLEERLVLRDTRTGKIYY